LPSIANQASRVSRPHLTNARREPSMRLIPPHLEETAKPRE
jgi:hypothetical protein